MDIDDLCIDCFKYTGGEDICMNCGFSQLSSDFENVLPPHTRINRYIIGRVIDVGDESVIYKAYDNSLGRIVAIKEFYPYRDGLVKRTEDGTVVVDDEERLEEFYARKQDFLVYSQAIRNTSNDYIVSIYDDFEEKGTAYHVMEFLEGLTLEEYFDQVNSLSFEEALDIMMPIMEAFEALHKSNIIYRSLSPKNIYITVNGDIKLGGFNNIVIKNADNINYPNNSIIIDGFSSPESYNGSGDSESSDIYSLGAMWYKILSGITPQDSILRTKKDKLQHLSKVGAEAPDFVDEVIFKAMSLKEKNRFSNLSDFIAAVKGEVSLSPKKNKLVPYISIAAVFIVLLAVGITAFHFIVGNSIVPIKSAEIMLWYPDGSDNQVNARWKTIEKDFNEYTKRQRKIGNLNITLKAMGVSREKYQSKLEKAFKDGNAPDIYCSVGLEKDDNSYSLETLYSQLDDGETYSEAFYGMKKLFESDNKIAVCYDLPVLYVSKFGSSYVPSKNTSLSFLQNYTEDSERFFSDPFVCNSSAVLYASYAYGYKDGKKTDVLKGLYNDARTYKYGKDWKPSDIVRSSTKYYLGMVSEYNEFYSNCFGKFVMIPLTGKSVKPNYIYPEAWSVNKNSSNENKKAAIFFLYYLINSSEGQRSISYVNGNAYYLPFKKSLVDEVISIDNTYKKIINYDYYPLADNSSVYAFRFNKADEIKNIALNSKSKEADLNKAASSVVK